MIPTDSDPDESALTHQPTDDELVGAFTMEEQTILFAVDDVERWIASDAAVDLADAV